MRGTPDTPLGEASPGPTAQQDPGAKGRQGHTPRSRAAPKQHSFRASVHPSREATAVPPGMPLRDVNNVHGSSGRLHIAKDDQVSHSCCGKCGANQIVLHTRYQGHILPSRRAARLLLLLPRLPLLHLPRQVRHTRVVPGVQWAVAIGQRRREGADGKGVLR